MKIFDITLPMTSQMPVWPGDPKVVLEQVESIDAGGHVNVSTLSCSVHTGTHVDAPHHFLNDHRTVETLSLEALTGPVQVVHLDESVDLVTAHVLETAAIDANTTRLLLRTRNSNLWQQGETRFHEDFVALSPDGAKWIAAHGIQLIGTDYLSVAPYQDSDATHQILLSAGIVILEGVTLNGIAAGIYDLYCLPLNLVGADGAPTRAILIKK